MRIASDEGVLHICTVGTSPLHHPDLMLSYAVSRAPSVSGIKGTDAFPIYFRMSMLLPCMLRLQQVKSFKSYPITQSCKETQPDPLKRPQENFESSEDHKKIEPTIARKLVYRSGRQLPQSPLRRRSSVKALMDTGLLTKSRHSSVVYGQPAV